MRPALVGNAPNSLVNLIDAQGLMRRGVQHGAVFFSCLVTPAGNTYRPRAWGGTEGTDALRQELKIKLYKAHFIPAVWDHHNTSAIFLGTATFSVIDGKPHVRVYANQEKSELAEGRDFISPQPIFIVNHKYEPYIPFPYASWATEERPARVEMEVSIDANGQLRNARVLKEDPPGKGYGDYALKQAHNATLLPAFRNGKPVESTTHPTIIYLPGFWGWKF